jgi:hypothetical protein
VTAETCNANPDNLCAAHHEGPLCQVCSNGYYKPTKGSLCVACGSASSVASYSTAGSLVIVLLGLLLAWLYVRRLRRRRAAEGKDKKEKCARKPLGRPTHVRLVLWRRLCSDSFRNKLKLVISVSQRYPNSHYPRPAASLQQNIGRSPLAVVPSRWQF